MTGFGEFPLVRRHHNLLAAQGVPNITGPIQKGNGNGKGGGKTGGGGGPTAGKGHGKGNGASGPAFSQSTVSEDFAALDGDFDSFNSSAYSVADNILTIDQSVAGNLLLTRNIPTGVYKFLSADFKIVDPDLTGDNSGLQLLDLLDKLHPRRESATDSSNRLHINDAAIDTTEITRRIWWRLRIYSDETGRYASVLREDTVIYTWSDANPNTTEAGSFNFSTEDGGTAETQYRNVIASTIIPTADSTAYTADNTNLTVDIG